MFDFLKQITAAHVAKTQLQDAQRLALEHAAAAEHHLALARMYEARVARLNRLQQTGVVA